jgi:Plasmid encoded RepA protein
MKKGLTPIGNIPLLKQIAHDLTPAYQKLLDDVLIIRQQPDAAEAAFMARQLVQYTLPHTNPGSVEAWQRRSGNLSLVIQPGWDAEKGRSVGYPYGTIPRLLLFWVTTEAVRTKQRRLELRRNLAQFIRDVGLNPNTGGGRRSDARRLKDQMTRLFSSRISVQQTIEEPNRHGKRWLNMDVAPKGEFWWDPKRPDQATLWENWVELGEDFYNAITAAPVPFDLRALRALKRSPLALDLYAWVCYRAFSIVRKSSSGIGCSSEPAVTHPARIPQRHRVALGVE